LRLPFGEEMGGLVESKVFSIKDLKLQYYAAGVGLSMVKILILNVDRDDDFGRKAGVQSPIVGVQSNLEAAVRLGRSDPEDSDLNAVFFAIRVYDAMKADGADVELVTLCGEINVGVKSDLRLVEQLDAVIAQTQASEAVLVSDGAEDEYILPLIQSRLKITAVQRVSVKQSRHIEDTYYRIVKLLDEDKVKKQFFLPIALILMVWAVFAIVGMAASGFGAILFTLGIYLLIRTFNSEKKLAVVWHEFRQGLLLGRPSFYTTILAIVIIAVTVFYTFDHTVMLQSNPLIIQVLSFLNDITWGIVAAGLLFVFGRVTDLFIREKKILWTYWIMPFSLFAYGFIASSVCKALSTAIMNYLTQNEFSIEPFLNLSFVGYVTVGIIIAFIGAVSNHYIKELHAIDEYELDIEEQTTKAAKQAK
jgi:putative membrane protein